MKQGNPADIVYDYIKNQIVTKAIYPGTRIVEEDLVRETGVSRTPVRSALMRLAYDGLIQQQPNRGAVVAKPSATDLRPLPTVPLPTQLIRDFYRLHLTLLSLWAAKKPCRSTAARRSDTTRQTGRKNPQITLISVSLSVSLYRS